MCSLHEARRGEDLLDEVVHLTIVVKLLGNCWLGSWLWLCRLCSLWLLDGWSGALLSLSFGGNILLRGRRLFLVVLIDMGSRVVRGLVVWVRNRMVRLVHLSVVLVLAERLKVQVTVSVITAEGLVVELMVLTDVAIAVE